MPNVVIAIYPITPSSNMAEAADAWAAAGAVATAQQDPHRYRTRTAQLQRQIARRLDLYNELAGAR